MKLPVNDGPLTWDSEQEALADAAKVTKRLFLRGWGGWLLASVPNWQQESLAYTGKVLVYGWTAKSGPLEIWPMRDGYGASFDYVQGDHAHNDHRVHETPEAALLYWAGRLEEHIKELVEKRKKMLALHERVTKKGSGS